jgi:hypothetical protein
VQSLYDLAQKEGLFKGVPLEIFDKLPHLLLWAAIDSESYSGFANGMLEQAQVPKTLRLFDHAAVLKLVEKMLAPKPKPP